MNNDTKNQYKYNLHYAELEKIVVFIITKFIFRV